MTHPAITILTDIASDKVTDHDLLLGLLTSVGASVGSMPNNPGGDHSYCNLWEWFDPFTLTSLDEVDDLPGHWARLVSRMNRECWECGYRYIHAPSEILGQYPRVPVRGIFAVTRGDATPETVRASDLIHLGGEFVDDDAGLRLGTLMHYIEQNVAHNAVPA